MNQINQSSVTTGSQVGAAEQARYFPDALPKLVEPARATSPVILAAMQAITRRPPRMRLRSKRAAKNGEAEAILQDILDTPDLTNMGGMAFDVASLLIQHGQEFANSSDPEVVEGFVLLGQIATMYEHLFLMQADQRSVTNGS
ncbi:MAG: hypothetical protein AAFN63_03715 [Pseudomonadota bacterium]